MSKLKIDELNASQELDRKAMAGIRGGQGVSVLGLLKKALTPLGERIGAGAGRVYCKAKGPNCGGASK
ncbi:MAG: hypothetical protein JJU06_08375 [Ectothiorhodospiraceae bacterium]|nr:hypothetical protein [Ectothiorhodospiraceae bacterium]MCH8506815.1 hypothetical protein [Ectothiorhodospiraceae bacterium]